jgi:ABC-type uncharacterized transport system permease subunit
MGDHDMEWTIVAMLASLVVASVVVGIWGENKGNSFYQGFFVSLLASPLIGAILVASTPRRRQVAQSFPKRHI